MVIAGTAPLSGSDAAAGAAFLRGCEGAVSERNAAGGLRPGRAPAIPARLDLRDDRSETPPAEQLIEELSATGAAVLLATPNDVRAIAQAIVAERVGRPLVVHPTTSPGVPSAHMRWVFALPRDAAPLAGGTPPEPAVLEHRARATCAAVLTALEQAEGLDPVQVRAALQTAR